MRRTSRANYFLDRIGRFRRPFLPVLLVVICVFAVVPNMVLVDTDGDGITDLSAVAVGASLIAHPTSDAGRHQRALNDYTIVALARDVMRRFPFRADEADHPSLHHRHPVQASLCLFRC